MCAARCLQNYQDYCFEDLSPEFDSSLPGLTAVRLKLACQKHPLRFSQLITSVMNSSGSIHPNLDWIALKPMAWAQCCLGCFVASCPSELLWIGVRYPTVWSLFVHLLQTGDRSAGFSHPRTHVSQAERRFRLVQDIERSYQGLGIKRGRWLLRSSKTVLWCPLEKCRVDRCCFGMGYCLQVRMGEGHNAGHGLPIARKFVRTGCCVFGLVFENASASNSPCEKMFFGCPEIMLNACFRCVC